MTKLRGWAVVATTGLALAPLCLFAQVAHAANDGRLVARLERREQTPAQYAVKWNGVRYQPGLATYRVNEQASVDMYTLWPGPAQTPSETAHAILP